MTDRRRWLILLLSWQATQFCMLTASAATISGSYYSDSDSTRDWFFASDEEEEQIMRAMERIGTFVTTASDSDTDEDEGQQQQHEYTSDNNDESEPLEHQATIDQAQQESRTEKRANKVPSVPQRPNIGENSIAVQKASATGAVATGAENNIERMPIPQTFRVLNQTSTVAPGPLTTPSQGISLESATLPSPTKQGRTATISSRKDSKQKGLDSITTPWVRQFLASCHRDILLPVPKDYCSDNFNLAHLPALIESIATAPDENGVAFSPSSAMTTSTTTTKKSTKPYPIYREALKLLVQDKPIPADIPAYLNRAATALYLQLHQRYVLSPRGLDMIRRRLLTRQRATSSASKNGRNTPNYGVDPIFGRCPRIGCQGMPLLPIGDSDTYSSGGREHTRSGPYETRAKRYCAVCRLVYYHWDSTVDGCAWGSSFCHLFLMVYGKEVFGDWHLLRDSVPHPHTATIFGFKLHPSTFQ